MPDIQSQYVTKLELEKGRVNINQVGTYNGRADVYYKNDLGVVSGLPVTVVQLEGKTYHLNVGDDLPSALASVTGQPIGSTNIHWLTMPSTAHFFCSNEYLLFLDIKNPTFVNN